MKSNDDIIIEKIISSFLDFNLRDIQEINNCELDFTIAEFILCSCFIDHLSGFRYNSNSVKRRYQDFVNEYLPNYDPKELYEDLRNKLVHNYSIGQYYGLTRKSPKYHLQIQDGKKILNLENFILDLKAALENFILELKSDNQIRQNALQWYSKHKILSQNRPTHII
jgi:hypothetical protein